MTDTTTDGRSSAEIRREIDHTRQRLSYDVNELTDSARPGNVARRQVSKVSRGVDRLMGAAQDAGESVVGRAGDVQQSGGDALASARDTTMQRTQGSPLAAGLVAAGVGWLVGSLLPASAPERRAVRAAEEAAEPIVEEAKSVAQDVAQNLKDPAQEAVQSVKEQAQESTQAVKDEGRSAADDVQASAKDSAEQVRSQTS